MSVIAAKKAGIKKIIVHSHTTKYKMYEIVVNRFFFKLCNTVNVSCGIKAGDAFFGKNNYIVLNNAIDVSKFVFKHTEKMSQKTKILYENKKVIGHLGSFTYPKNHRFIIEVAEELRQRRDDFVVLLYGEGELLDNIKLLIEQKGLQDYVKVVGVTSNPVETYQAFDIFILPSIYEGFPVTLLEAQLSSIYTLASDNVTREVDLGVNKIEFLKLDSNLWADRINLLLDADTSNSKIDSFDKYDVNIQWRKLYDIYK